MAHADLARPLGWHVEVIAPIGRAREQREGARTRIRAGGHRPLCAAWRFAPGQRRGTISPGVDWVCRMSGRTLGALPRLAQSARHATGRRLARRDPVRRIGPVRVGQRLAAHAGSALQSTTRFALGPTAISPMRAWSTISFAALAPAFADRIMIEKSRPPLRLPSHCLTAMIARSIETGRNRCILIRRRRLRPWSLPRLVTAVPAGAQAYPRRAVHLIVPYARLRPGQSYSCGSEARVMTPQRQ